MGFAFNDPTSREINDLINREPIEFASDYERMKALLLQRYKLSPETFRIKFAQHQKKGTSTWKDLTFELQNYLDEGVTGLGEKDFEGLKDLMVADQIKRKVKDHFIDEWAELKEVDQLAKKLDVYELVQGVHRKPMEKRDVEFKRVEMRKPPVTEGRIKLSWTKKIVFPEHSLEFGVFCFTASQHEGHLPRGGCSEWVTF